MSDKVYLSIPAYNGIIQFLNGQPHGAVRQLIDAIEKEVLPQAQAQQTAAQAAAETATSNTTGPEAGLTD